MRSNPAIVAGRRGEVEMTTLLRNAGFEAQNVQRRKYIDPARTEWIMSDIEFTDPTSRQRNEGNWAEVKTQHSLGSACDKILSAVVELEKSRFANDSIGLLLLDLGSVVTPRKIRDIAFEARKRHIEVISRGELETSPEQARKIVRQALARQRRVIKEQKIVKAAHAELVTRSRGPIGPEEWEMSHVCTLTRAGRCLTHDLERHYKDYLLRYSS